MLIFKLWRPCLTRYRSQYFNIFLLIKNKFMESRITSTVAPKLFVRHDQSISASNKEYQDDNVIIVAPKWVKEGLKELSKYIPPGTKFNVYDKSKSGPKSVIIQGELTLKDLVMIARNEPANTSGLINFANYEPIITNANKNVIYALKDLVRQCVIVARDKTTHYGGYSSRRSEEKEEVYIADLIGLQFQLKHNSGRLVQIGRNLPEGLLDELIFREVVGEDKKSYKDVIEDTSGRYIKHEDIYLDTFAYKKFVSNDVLLSGLALNIIAKDKLNFKFLKYGTGFFAGAYSQILNEHIYEGVANGFDKLFSSNDQKWIKSVDLPFYRKCQLIFSICQKHKIECRFSNDDALKKAHSKYITATTNCADPHAITGNEMGYSSVDAAIAENLKSKANIFSPFINLLIREQFIEVNTT